MRGAQLQSPPLAFLVVSTSWHHAGVAGGAVRGGEDPPSSISCTSEAGQDSFRETQSTEELQGTAGSRLLSANHGQDVSPARLFSYNLMISRKEIGLARQPHLLRSCLFFVRFVLLHCVTPDSTIKLADKTISHCDGGPGGTTDVSRSHPLIFLRFKKTSSQIPRFKSWLHH